MKIIVPKRYVSMSEADSICFLMGPVLGGGEWQMDALSIIAKYDEQHMHIFVATPHPMRDLHPLWSNIEKDQDDQRFDRQLTWERYYLERASRSREKGGIICWLPCENKNNPRNDGNPYARDSYGEIGEWRGRMMVDPGIRFTIGADPAFPGLDIIRRNFRLALGRDITFHSTLVATIHAAMTL